MAVNRGQREGENNETYLGNMRIHNKLMISFFVRMPGSANSGQLPAVSFLRAQPGCLCHGVCIGVQLPDQQQFEPVY